VVQIDTTNLVYDISEEQEYYYKFTSSDDGQGSVTYHGIGLPGWLSINLNTGVLRGTPNNENVDDFNISVYVSDGTDVIRLVIRSMWKTGCLKKNPVK